MPANSALAAIYMDIGYENLINSLVADSYLKTPEIIRAFKNADRGDFVLEGDKDNAYANAPLSIGFGQTISQPLTVAFMMELLRPKHGDKILEVGSGSGWQTAILANCVDHPEAETHGRIIAMERLPELKELCEKNLSKYNFIKNKSVAVILGDASKGYKNEAPYDKIISAAAVSGEIPVAWKKQLKIGGRIVTPAGQSILVIEKISKTKYTKQEHFGFSFVPLITGN